MIAVQDRMGTTVHRVAIDLHDEVAIGPKPLSWIRHIDRICLEFGSSFTKDARSGQPSFGGANTSGAG